MGQVESGGYLTGSRAGGVQVEYGLNRIGGQALTELVRLDGRVTCSNWSVRSGLLSLFLQVRQGAGEVRPASKIFGASPEYLHQTARMAPLRVVPRVWGRLRRGVRYVAEATGAATVAWYIATDVLGHVEPFFAPVAALIVLGQARGERIWRTVEILLGVAGGVLAADLVVLVLGTRSLAAIVAVTLLVTTVTVLLGVGPLLATQAAVSALYVAVIAPPTDSLIPVRFVDALVGGVVALVASQLSRPRDPVTVLVTQVLAVMDEAAAVVDAAADAIQANDTVAARAVLDRARQADAGVEGLRAEVAAAREALWVDLRRRERLGRVAAVEAASEQVDYLVRNVRVLSRLAVTVTWQATDGDSDLAHAVHQMALAVRRTAAVATLGLHLPVEAPDPAEEAVLEAVRAAAALLGADPAFPAVLLIGQIRACAIDLLRVAGQDRDASVLRVEQALGFSPG